MAGDVVTRAVVAVQHDQARDRRARRVRVRGRRLGHRHGGVRRHVRSDADGHRIGGALLMQAFPTRSIGELKALLVNNGETKIYNNLKTEPGYLAPITRIGGGEVRVDRALGATAAAWDASKPARAAVVRAARRDAPRPSTLDEDRRGPQLQLPVPHVRAQLDLPLRGRRGLGARQRSRSRRRITVKSQPRPSPSRSR